MPSGCGYVVGGIGVYCGAWCCCSVVGVFIGAAITGAVADALGELCDRLETGTQTTCTLSNGAGSAVCDWTCQHNFNSEWEAVEGGAAGEACLKTGRLTAACPCESDVKITVGDAQWSENDVLENKCLVVKFNENKTETTANTTADGEPTRRLAGSLDGLDSREDLMEASAAERRLYLGQDWFAYTFWCLFVPEQDDLKDELYIGWTKQSITDDCKSGRDALEVISASLFGSGIASVFCFCACCCAGVGLIVAEHRKSQNQIGLAPPSAHAGQPAQPYGQAYVAQPAYGQALGAQPQYTPAYGAPQYGTAPQGPVAFGQPVGQPVVVAQSVQPVQAYQPGVTAQPQENNIRF